MRMGECGGQQRATYRPLVRPPTAAGADGKDEHS
jgi:hypothetical protein